jgi:hypothetical protein
MKTTKEPSEVEIHEDGGVGTGTVIMISFVSLLVGFILGATVAILKIQPMVTPTPALMVGPTVKESGKNVTVDYEKEIRHPEVERK